MEMPTFLSFILELIAAISQSNPHVKGILFYSELLFVSLWQTNGVLSISINQYSQLTSHIFIFNCDLKMLKLYILLFYYYSLYYT